MALMTMFSLLLPSFPSYPSFAHALTLFRALFLPQSCRLSRMVCLGAVDYQALKIECIKRDQVGVCVCVCV